MPQEQQKFDVSKAVDSAINILKVIGNLSPTGSDLLLTFSEAGKAKDANADMSGRLFGKFILQITGTEKTISLQPEHLFSEDIRKAFTALAKDPKQDKIDGFLKAIYQSIEENPHWQKYWKSVNMEPAKKQKLYDFALGSLTYMIIGAVQQPGTDALVNEATAGIKNKKAKEDTKITVLRKFHTAINKIMTVAKYLSTVNATSVGNKFEFDHTNYNKFIANQPAPSVRNSSLFKSHQAATPTNNPASKVTQKP